MALSRVTPSGWVEETGTTNRVAPFGWIQETQAAAGGGIIKTIHALVFASVKNYDGLAIASVKTIHGAAAQ